jgi:large subunit ribosomal protein L9
MAKRVQLVLTKDVSKLGKMGDLVEVAPGYSRNYLIPQGLAMGVNPGILKQVERRREIERARLAELKKVALTQQETLEKLGSVTIKKAVGENEAIFGTVTNQEVADLIKAASDIEVDKRDINVPEIKKLGDYRVEFKLHPDVSVNLGISVVAE